MGEKLSSQKIFEEIQKKLGVLEDREEYIRSSIIPRMDKRRGRENPLRQSSVLLRMQSTPSSGKQGEEYEMMEEMVMANDGVTPGFAAEIADEIYYCLQRNAPAETLSGLSFFLEGILGIEMETAYAFCIFKYETRLVCGNLLVHKEVELTVLDSFLSTRPDLQTLWENPTS